MRILVRFLFVGLLVLSGATASSIGAAAQDDRFAYGLLWRIERAGVPPSYLFGTAHVADPDIRTLAEPVAEAFAASDSLSLEVLFTPEVEARWIVAMLPSGGQSLDRILGAELFGRVVDYSGLYFEHPQHVKGLKPWALLMCFTLSPSEFKRQMRGDLNLDFWLQREAERTGKHVYGLETGEEHLDALAGLPLGTQIALLEAIVERGDPEAQFAAVSASYRARDLAAMTRWVDEWLAGLDVADTEVIRNHLLIERNHRMVERMARRLTDGRAFIAVGAAHLPGEEGLLRLLEQRGFAVTPVY